MTKKKKFCVSHESFYIKKKKENITALTYLRSFYSLLHSFFPSFACCHHPAFNEISYEITQTIENICFKRRIILVRKKEIVNLGGGRGREQSACVLQFVLSAFCSHSCEYDEDQRDFLFFHNQRMCMVLWPGASNNGNCFWELISTWL